MAPPDTGEDPQGAGTFAPPFDPELPGPVTVPVVPLLDVKPLPDARPVPSPAAGEPLV